MIKQGDLSRPARVMVQDGEERDWRRPWRKRPKWRVVFVGYINRMDRDNNGVRIELEEAMSRFSRSQWMPFDVHVTGE